MQLKQINLAPIAIKNILIPLSVKNGKTSY